MRRRIRAGHDHRHLSADKVGSQHPHSVGITLGATELKVYVPAHDITLLRKALVEACQHRSGSRVRIDRIEPADGRQLACLLRTRRQRPSRGSAA
jgi:hypothetical protein